jgi:penicillin amidase
MAKTERQVRTGIYEMWQRRLISNVRDLSVPKEVRDYIGNIEMTKIIRWLHAPDGRFGADPIAGRDAMLTKSLEEAVAELTKRFGPEQGEWKLGAFHHATIPHFMTASRNSAASSTWAIYRVAAIRTQ